MDALKKLAEETARKRKALANKGLKVLHVRQPLAAGQEIELKWGGALYLGILLPQGKKYVKRSELERISTGEEPPEEEAVTTPPSTSILQSPTSLVPVEDSPIFSIPKSEVNHGFQGCSQNKMH